LLYICISLNRFTNSLFARHFTLKGWSSDATLDKNQLICPSGKSARPVDRSDRGISVGREG
jgi:hypothetical protein